ncbi:hypothetical protein ACELLULO517_15515 [Acidisoma cellulosilytica]|uniref:Uncharacterized protein n=1 Tax=Acidisoma cellulosilyticum TaxID=2802395 RepID=A0A964E4R7_9PROT|nr:hypothetical protein [Acidisoma cellulosilyticum]MCB8881657.1 hypothetical protein [Acidisoma cellulosilyticum]
MSWIRTILREVWGLFVDDGRFAVAIIVWLLIVWLALPRLGISLTWKGPFLFLGLAAILLESTWRRASRAGSR